MAQGLIGAPGIALGEAREALGKVDLVAVAGLDVALYLVEGGPILFGLQVTGHRREQLKSPLAVLRRLRKRDQAFAFTVGQAWVEHQLAGAVHMVADQCPGIQAQLCVGEA